MLNFSYCPSLEIASDRDSVLNELTDTELITKIEVQKSLEGTNTEISLLREFSEKQKLTIIECKCTLSQTGKREIELAHKN